MGNYRDERREFEKEEAARFEDALDLLSLEMVEMGGDCQAYSFSPRQGFTCLVYSTEYELTAPTALDEPVTVFTIEEGAGPEGEDITLPPVQWPSFRAWITDTYGPIEGEPLPDCLTV